MSGAGNGGGLTGLGGKIVASLPAQYLLLLLINVFFVCGLLWFLDQREETRERLIAPILTDCIQHKEHQS